MPLASPHTTWRRSMTDAEVQDFVTRFAAAWAARDGRAFVELWHPEGLLHTPLVGRPVAGSELNRLMEVQTAAAPDFVWQLLDWTARGMWSLSNGRPPASSTARGSTGAAPTNFASRPAKSPRSGSTATPRRCAHFAPARRWSRSPDSSWRADLSGDGLRSDQAVDFVEVAGDAHAQLFHLGRWRQQVRHHDGHHPGAGRGPHAVIGILQGNAAFRLDAEPLGRFQK